MKYPVDVEALRKEAAIVFGGMEVGDVALLNVPRSPWELEVKCGVNGYTVTRYYAGTVAMVYRNLEGYREMQYSIRHQLQEMAEVN